jgi:hypothetical protein
VIPGRRLRTAGLMAGAAALAIPTLVATPAATATPAGPSNYFGVAGADGTRVTYSITGFLIVDNPVDSATVTAQAVVSDLDSTGLAAAPEPGSTVRSVPGTAAGFAPVALPPAAYPLVASSSTSHPSATVSQGPIQLTAESTAQSSQATAMAAGQSARGAVLGSVTAHAKAQQDPVTGAVTSSSTSDTEPGTFAGVLTIGHTHASASARGNGDGGPATSESAFEADGVTVAGQAVKITPAGLELAGASSPLPPGDPITSALKAANLTVTYLAPVKSAQGITSAGVTVQQSAAIPNSPSPGVLTVTFGRADAYATAPTQVDRGDLTGGSLGAPGLPPMSASGPANPGAAVARGGSSPVMSPSSGPMAGPAGTPPEPPAAAGATPSPTVPSNGRLATRRVEQSQTSSASFYLVLVFAALAILVSGKGIRMFAVKLAWT